MARAEKKPRRREPGLYLRMSPELKSELMAKAKGASLNTAIVTRLEESLATETRAGGSGPR